jgi:hypothetical protein
MPGSRRRIRLASGDNSGASKALNCRVDTKSRICVRQCFYLPTSPSTPPFSWAPTTPGPAPRATSSRRPANRTGTEYPRSTRWWPSPGHVAHVVKCVPAGHQLVVTTHRDEAFGLHPVPALEHTHDGRLEVVIAHPDRDAEDMQAIHQFRNLLEEASFPLTRGAL